MSDQGVIGVENVVAEVKETIESVVESVKEEIKETVESVKEELKEKVEDVKEQVKEKVEEVVTELAENAVQKVEEVTQKKCAFLLPIVKILRTLIPKKKQVSSVTVHKYTVCDECKKKIPLKEEVKAEAS
jgi:RNA polymerase-binding transcription factor DksA